MNISSSARFWVVLHLPAYAIMLFMNYLANALPLNGMTTGELSAKYPNLFVPAGITFSIWGIIYIALLAFVIYGFSLLFKNKNQKTDDCAYFLRSRPWFLVTCLANAAWIWCWHYEYVPASVIVMLVLLFSLIVLYHRLGIGEFSPTTPQKWFVHIPFSIYLGWISIATIANITALLVDLEWMAFGLSESLWSQFMIAAGTTLGLIFLLRKDDFAYAAVIIWAFAGIFLKRLQAGDIWTDSIPFIAMVCSAIIIIFGTAQALKITTTEIPEAQK
ncbi:MAG: hypothetical protein JJU28_18455 [Cyclobacteriaceae bacterium]|nr:hypothetical protein [Cyclobacteriaceae bacterium]